MPSSEYLRYVAMGDSQTEGLGDGDDTVGLRGWADRLAEHLAAVNPRLLYANLAVRGRVAAQVRTEQLGPALALRPDLVTVVAGINDLLRPRFNAATVAGHLEEMFAALTATGAHVVTLTFPDVGKIAPLARPVRSRVLDLNNSIRAAADRHGVSVAETARQAVATDPRLWSADRLHASPLGHERIAAAVAQALTLPGSDDAWTLPLPPQAVPAGRQAAAAELRWAAAFLGPWLGRRLRGQSSGDNRTAKRPQLLPLSAMP
ncbi:SGNH/GDSL hydrolase family protein [Streptomyces sp. NPDC051219]|uniref:SGNH/GDSL hydrolase family protein n=1 Tax=Streptomyces sp. NPDC051219 TaxID=3155283 RepID=UPI00341E3D3A